MTTLGERLRKSRKRKGLSQSAASEAIGISNKALSRYETDASYPALEVLKKLGRLYDVSSEYLLGNTGAMGESSDTAYNPEASENMISMTDHKASAKKLIDFIAASPSRYHAVANICLRLSNEGFKELRECEKWDIAQGGKYYVTRNLSSVIAFKVGEGDVGGFNIIAAHSDSPTFRVKPDAEMETLGKYIRINTERYGGMICSTWLDRPLSIAGRVVTTSGSKIKTQLVNIDKDLLMIPNVAIHMQRNINDGMSFNAQVDMIPLLGSTAAKGSLMKTVAEAAGVKPDEISGSDLFLYNRMRGTIWGNDGEFVSAPQLDDLQCAFASLNGFLAGDNAKTVSMLCVLDNEEVGSGTKQGADSDFLRTSVSRICEKTGGRAYAFKLCDLCGQRPRCPSEPSRIRRPCEQTNHERRNRAEIQRQPALCDRRRLRSHIQKDLQGGSSPCSDLCQPLRPCGRFYLGKYIHRSALDKHRGHRACPACNAFKL